MRYAVISINDRCAKNIQRTHDILSGWDFVDLTFFNAFKEDWRTQLAALGVSTTPWLPEKGEAGAYISHFWTWMWASRHGPLTVFEDDAMLDDKFQDKHSFLLSRTPDDFDFLSLWVPEDQINHYEETISSHPEGLAPPALLGKSSFNVFEIDGVVARSYQGYGHVGTTYSAEGGRRLIALARTYGLYATVDCFMHFQALARNVKGYAPTPEYNTLVHHDWTAPTTVHGTGY